MTKTNPFASCEKHTLAHSFGCDSFVCKPHSASHLCPSYLNRWWQSLLAKLRALDAASCSSATGNIDAASKVGALILPERAKATGVTVYVVVSGLNIMVVSKPWLMLLDENGLSSNREAKVEQNEGLVEKLVAVDRVAKVAVGG